MAVDKKNIFRTGLIKNANHLFYRKANPNTPYQRLNAPEIQRLLFNTTI
jgi:hypothetical protein